MPPHLALLIKPSGADCNLDCSYCFYLEKAGLYPETRKHRMSEETAEILARRMGESRAGGFSLCFQGGEPTLMGLDFYRKAVEFQEGLLRPDQTCQNSIQTNGLLIDEDWARFFKSKNFLIGLSIDGTAEMHDRFRLTKGGRDSHSRVIETLRVFQEVETEYNILCVVSSANVEHPQDLFDYFTGLGARFLQFIPLLEYDKNGNPTVESITPQQYGEFLCGVFDRWWNDGDPNVYVRFFDELLVRYVTGTHPSCVFQRTCGSYLVIEHTGDVYPCDFFVEPDWKVGNIHDGGLDEFLNSTKQRSFGDSKGKLPQECKECDWLAYCYGGCLKYRSTPFDGSTRTRWCESYLRFYPYAHDRMLQLGEQVSARIVPPAPANIMVPGKGRPGRNDPCPCGSGKKYKKCCGAASAPVTANPPSSTLPMIRF